MNILFYVLFISVALSSSLLSSAQVVIENFEKNTYTPSKQTAPAGWDKGNKKDDKIDYYIVKEGKNTFLRAKTMLGTSGKIIRLDKKFDLKSTPYLSWHWRAWKFPKMDNQKEHEEADNVATVYVVFKDKYMIKYDWSQRNCKTVNAKPFFFKSKSSGSRVHIFIRPLRCTNSKIACCNDKSGEWVAEKVNLVDDFKKIYKEVKWKPEYIAGIGILTDGDDTKTEGVSADFDNFTLSSE
ncbi:MAG: DUF3047 domain-containing protein [bacterium]